MKKILTILLFLFIGLVLKAQYPIYDNVRIYGYLTTDDSITTQRLIVDSIEFADGDVIHSSKVDTAEWAINALNAGDSIFGTVTGDTVVANNYLDVNGNADVSGIAQASYFNAGTSTDYGRYSDSYMEIIDGLSTKTAINPTVSDGSGAIAYDLNTSNTLVTSGAKILKVSNNGTEVFNVSPDGISINGGDVITISDTVNAFTAIQEYEFDSLTIAKGKIDTLELGITWHAIGGFEDSTITVTISSSNTWYHGTNSTNNAVIGIDAAGFSISGDTLICNKAGDFRGMLSITWSGTVGNEYQFRAYNVTQARQIAFKQGQTASGASSYNSISFPLYEELTEGDRVVFQVQNISAANDIILRHYQFEAVYLHE